MNIVNIFDISDPYLDDLVPGTDHCLIGIVNAPVQFVPIVGQARVILNVPLRTGTLENPTQCVIEIVADKKEVEPKFSYDWSHLQLAILQNCTFKGIRTNYGLDFHIFRMANEAPSIRYIWLSSPRRDFWMDPVPEPETPADSVWQPITTTSPSTSRGVLDRSRGSVIGKNWCRRAREIHTDYRFDGMRFSDFCVIVQKLKRDIVMNRELILVDGSYAQKTKLSANSPPMMHQ